MSLIVLLNVIDLTGKPTELGNLRFILDVVCQKRRMLTESRRHVFRVGMEFRATDNHLNSYLIGFR